MLHMNLQTFGGRGGTGTARNTGGKTGIIRTTDGKETTKEKLMSLSQSKRFGRLIASKEARADILASLENGDGVSIDYNLVYTGGQFKGQKGIRTIAVYKDENEYYLWYNNTNDVDKKERTKDFAKALSVVEKAVKGGTEKRGAMYTSATYREDKSEPPYSVWFGNDRKKVKKMFKPI